MLRITRGRSGEKSYLHEAAGSGLRSIIGVHAGDRTTDAIGHDRCRYCIPAQILSVIVFGSLSSLSATCHGARKPAGVFGEKSNMPRQI